jgi:hypothetical protein
MTTQLMQYERGEWFTYENKNILTCRRLEPSCEACTKIEQIRHKQYTTRSQVGAVT